MEKKNRYRNKRRQFGSSTHEDYLALAISAKVSWMSCFCSVVKRDNSVRESLIVSPTSVATARMKLKVAKVGLQSVVFSEKKHKEAISTTNFWIELNPLITYIAEKLTKRLIQPDYL
ncbi:unnamed protein product [Caenorhabditis auriculariae]|uniref:Uncharacterized protein n=1 Tax=Caenorhabditis auriculariae TaxID=2777116 RepID=A0A8S1HSL7_9PELO|nr:unnamed protein product [Caenorhabditis auriculariae]